jgi:hypothetical protein
MFLRVSLYRAGISYSLLHLQYSQYGDGLRDRILGVVPRKGHVFHLLHKVQTGCGLTGLFVSGYRA